jgi:N-acetylmuramoyl-L-alanine amidase
MKNVLASIAAVSVVGGTAVDVAQAAPNETQQQASLQAVQNETQTAKYTVNADGLRVRTGPSTSHAVLGLVGNGETLQVTGEVDGWYKVSYNGQTAYVSKNFVTATAVSANGEYTVNVSSLRVRTGPSTSHPIIGGLSKGQSVQVIGEVQDWYKISYNGQSAYISKDYVSKAGGGQPQPQPQVTVRTDGSYVVNVESLRIRKGPATYHPIIGGVLKGQTLKVTGIENGWYKIERNGTTGYVSSEYVTFVQGAAPQQQPAPQPQPVQVEDYYVSVSALNVRSGAGTNYGVIDVLRQGQKVQASDEQSGWLKISYNGKTGYVAKDFVSKTMVSPAETNTPSQPNTSGSSASAAALTAYAKSLVGTPYVWGGTTPNGFDCSGFIYHVYSKFGFSFGRMSVAGYWSSFTKTSNPQPGDLIYFQNTYKPGASHMGVYLGNGTFVQAGDNGVAISSLSNSYWKSHFLGYTKPY